MDGQQDAGSPGGRFDFSELAARSTRAASLKAFPNAGARVLFSFEEAIGFCVGTTVVDKVGGASAGQFVLRQAMGACEKKRIGSHRAAVASCVEVNANTPRLLTQDGVCASAVMAEMCIDLHKEVGWKRG